MHPNQIEDSEALLQGAAPFGDRLFLDEHHVIGTHLHPGGDDDVGDVPGVQMPGGDLSDLTRLGRGAQYVNFCRIAGCRVKATVLIQHIGQRRLKYSITPVSTSCPTVSQ